jgi:hypothetical protein
LDEVSILREAMMSMLKTSDKKLDMFPKTKPMILLMEEILHQLIGGLSHYL